MEELYPGAFVTLNVGGVPYTTSVLTLTSIPDSMLGGMFSGRIKAKRDEGNGHYLIDRDGELFRYVLNFLRNQTLGIPEDFKELKMLLLEAEFYQIEPMCEAIRRLMIKPDPEVIEVEVRSFHALNQWERGIWIQRINRIEREDMRWTIHGANETLRRIPCLIGIIDKLQDSSNVPSTTSGDIQYDFLRLKFLESVDRTAHSHQHFNRSGLFLDIGRLGFTLKATETYWPTSGSVQWQRWVFTRV